ncbi:hypothetical protein SAMN05421870_107267 [Streptomyces qinglanensis]|uniref:Uncharacterized protein n=1 Tax=Streptomyces qinglanensis TaxID=943816 RepID=A0A1H9U3D2_9ACTN|nr:hypothetical protein SAMN05421870_107267 [Streptomyces qinglanensis]
MHAIRALATRLIPPTYCPGCGWWVRACPHMN